MRRLPDYLRVRGAVIDGKDVPLHPADILIDYERMVIVKKKGIAERGRVIYETEDYPASHHVY